MANDFSADGNCKALWNLESGALTTDSKGTNTLANTGVAEDLVNFKQGACSGLFVHADADRLSITDALLDSGFPLKSGEANRTFSFCFWVKPTTASIWRHCITKVGAAGTYSFYITVDTTPAVRMMISIDGTTQAYYIHASALILGQWYHVAITHNAADDSYRIRIWDDTAGAILGVDKTGVTVTPFISAATFYLSYNSSIFALNGNLDEVVVFDDVLSVADIDAIRAGTYGGGAPPAVPKFGSLNRNFYGPPQKTGLYTEI